MRVVWALFSSAAFASVVTVIATAAQSPEPPQLRIVVLEGEAGVNVVQQRTAVTPVVEVRDRNDQPVVGALVRFAVRSGRATFSGARSVTVTTNAVGRAAAVSLTPTGTGTLQIAASATFQGQTAIATITQINVATAAQAASMAATGSVGTAGGGGGIGPGAISAIAGGAAAGGVVAYERATDKGPPPLLTELEVHPTIGLQSSTAIYFTPNGPGGGYTGSVKAVYEFGDGAVVSLDARNSSTPVYDIDIYEGHVYQAPGTYTATVSHIDPYERSGSVQGSVTIKTMAGRWALGATGSAYNLTQSGSTLTGTFTTVAGPGSGSVTGQIDRETCDPVGTPTLRLVTTPTGPGNPSTFTARLCLRALGDADTADLIKRGTFVSGVSTSFLELVRQ